MPYYDIKKFTYKYKLGGSTCKTQYNNSPSGTRPKSEYEARKQCEEWILKRHPGCQILELNIEFK